MQLKCTKKVHINVPNYLQVREVITNTKPRSVIVVHMQSTVPFNPMQSWGPWCPYGHTLVLLTVNDIGLPKIITFDFFLLVPHPRGLGLRREPAHVGRKSTHVRREPAHTGRGSIPSIWTLDSQVRNLIANQPSNYTFKSHIWLEAVLCTLFGYSIRGSRGE